jgi:hypothetical protein
MRRRQGIGRIRASCGYLNKTHGFLPKHLVPLETAVISWLVRGALIVSGAVTGLFVAKDARNFTLLQGMTALLVIVLVVFVLAFWPARWTRLLNRRNKMH